MGFSPILGIIILILLVGGFFVANYIAKNRRPPSNDPYSDTVNDTVYTVSMLNEDEIERMTPTEARNMLASMEESDYSSLPEHDFFALKRRAEQAD